MLVQTLLPVGSPLMLEGPLGDTATTSDSYRRDTGLAPRSGYLQNPVLQLFVPVAGAQDAACHADRCAAMLGAVTNKETYIIVSKQGHLRKVDTPETARVRSEFPSGV